jgi:hypothetical protein
MKAQFFLFNIEGYGEFFSGITPRYSSTVQTGVRGVLQIDSLKMSTVKNPTFTFDLTQIQVVSFQCNQFFIQNHKNIKYVYGH